jgi:hypothetical protein
MASTFAALPIRNMGVCVAKSIYGMYLQFLVKATYTGELYHKQCPQITSDVTLC